MVWTGEDRDQVLCHPQDSPGRTRVLICVTCAGFRSSLSTLCATSRDMDVASAVLGRHNSTCLIDCWVQEALVWCREQNVDSGLI
eukprot:198267-Rhodomonas_salina.1